MVYAKFQFILQFIRRGGASTRPLPATIDLIAFISSMALVSADGGTFLSLNKKVPKEVSLRGARAPAREAFPLRIPQLLLKRVRCWVSDFKGTA